MFAKMGKFFSKSKPKHRPSLQNDAPNTAFGICGSGVAVSDRTRPNEDQVQHITTPVHSEPVTCVEFVTPGLLLSGSKDEKLVLYDYLNRRIKQKWSGHDREITKVAYAPNIQSFFSASRDKNINLWRSDSLDPVRQFKGHDLVVNGLALNIDDTQLCSGSRDNTLRIWDIESGACTLQNSVTRNLVTHVHWAPNSDVIAQTGEDKELKIWDARSLTITQTFIRKQYIQNWCDISEDRNYCLTCSNGFQGSGCEATLWDLRMSKIVREYKGHMESIGSCLFLKSQHLIATCSSDCSVRIWDRDSANCLTKLPIPGSGPLTSLSLCDDNKIAVSSFNTGIHILQGPTGPTQMDLQELIQY